MRIVNLRENVVGTADLRRFWIQLLNNVDYSSAPRTRIGIIFSPLSAVALPVGYEVPHNL
jgi:hypothetical protein